MNTQTMNAKDAVSAKLATIYWIQGNRRKRLMQAKNLKASAEKKKVKVAILGRQSEGNKSVGLSYSGSLTIYQNTDLFTEMMLELQKTGVDQYFDLLVVNDDPTSAAGERIVTLKDCNIDNADLALFDADGEFNEQELNFTFESFDINQKFQELAGM